MLTTLIIASIARIASTMSMISSPILLGVWIIIFAFFTSLGLRRFLTSWLGLIMFIIYIGGLLVMFAYFVALTPNPIIKGVPVFIFLLATTALLITLFFIYPPLFQKRGASLSQAPLIRFLTINPSTVVTLALVLFLALVAVVKLCATTSSPLRPYSLYVSPYSQTTPLNQNW